MRTHMALRRWAILGLGCAGALATAPLAGQNPSWEGAMEPGFELMVTKPYFADEGFTFATGTVQLSGRVRLSDPALLVFELPFTHAGIDVQGLGGESSNTLGNPYVGIELRRPASRWHWAFGARIPLKVESGDDDFASIVGIMSDLHRMEAYMSKVVAVSGSGAFEARSAAGFTLRLQGGPVLGIPFGDESDYEDPEAMLAYSAMVGHESSPLGVSVGLAGRAILTESDLESGQRTIDHLAAQLRLGSGRVQPIFGARLPLDDEYAEMLDSVVSIGVRIRTN
jgi:hypothetical protein